MIEVIQDVHRSLFAGEYDYLARTYDTQAERTLVQRYGPAVVEELRLVVIKKLRFDGCPVGPIVIEPPGIACPVPQPAGPELPTGQPVAPPQLPPPPPEKAPPAAPPPDACVRAPAVRVRTRQRAK